MVKITNTNLLIDRVSACMAHVTHFCYTFREGWSKVLSIPSLHKLQRYQIYIVSLPSSSND